MGPEAGSESSVSSVRSWVREDMKKCGSLGSNEAGGENKLIFVLFVCLFCWCFSTSFCWLDSTMNCYPSLTGIPDINLWRGD